MSHILIIEDERVIRSSLSRLLERNGYSTEEAESIAEATSKFDLNDFDLIIINGWFKRLEYFEGRIWKKSIS